MVSFFFLHGSLFEKAKQSKSKQTKMPLEQYTLSAGYAFLEGYAGYFSPSDSLAWDFFSNSKMLFLNLQVL